MQFPLSLLKIQANTKLSHNKLDYCLSMPSSEMKEADATASVFAGVVVVEVTSELGRKATLFNASQATNSELG